MLDFKLNGHSEFVKKVRSVEKKMSRMDLVHKSIVIWLDRWIQKNFETEGKKATSGGWKKLKPVTIQRRRSTGKGPRAGLVKILQDTGTLKSKWKHYYTKKVVKITSALDNPPYGLFHDEGAGHLPKRQIIPEEKQVKKEVKMIYSHWVKRNLK